jgi:hypothetical protein
MRQPSPNATLSQNSESMGASTGEAKVLANTHAIFTAQNAPGSIEVSDILEDQNSYGFRASILKDTGEINYHDD